QLGRRVTLIDETGRVRGDAEFDRAALAGLENHASRPEVRGAMETGLGRAERLSASTNARQLYVAVRGGPPGIAVVRVSASLAGIDARIHAVQRAALGAGFLMLVGAGIVAGGQPGPTARPLIDMWAPGLDFAAGRPAVLPDSHIPE